MIVADRELEQLAAVARDIPGLRFRRLRLPDDLVRLSEMNNRAAAADDLDERESPEDWDSWFSHPTGFDPMTDTLVGETDDRIVGYAQARAQDDNDGGRNYPVGGEVDPDYRGKGIGQRPAAVQHPPPAGSGAAGGRDRARCCADRAQAGELGL